jgi:hypothetical protein
MHSANLPISETGIREDDRVALNLRMYNFKASNG